MKFPLRLDGLIAATFTPLQSDGGLHLSRIPDLVEHLLAQGVGGLYILGSTGEGASLTCDERRAVATAYVQAAAGRLPTIIQVGHESVREAQGLAAHAQEIGAHAISAVSPVYFRPDSVPSLVKSMAYVAAGAPRLPFYYYHIPAISRVELALEKFLCEAVDTIPTLQGVKYTSPVAHEFQGCLEQFAGRLQLLWGTDEMLTCGLTCGATAAVGSTYNFAAPVYRKLLQSFHGGALEEARSYQTQSQAIVRTFVQYGPRAAQKAIMGLIGLDCGPPRLPTLPLEMPQIDALRRDLEQLGFFDWIKA